METVYLDELFLTELAADYLLCLLSMRVCSVTLKRRRCIFAAFIGAVYSACAYLPDTYFLRSGGAKLAVGIIMCAVCFYNEKSPLRCTLVFFTMAAALSGAVSVLGGEGGIKMKTLAISFALCYLLISAAFRGKAALPDRPRSTVRIEHSGRSAELFALIDTGSELRDSLSGNAVMLISLHTAARLFPDCAELFCESDGVHTLELINQQEQYRGKFRLIPCTTAAGTALLPLFRPEKLLIDGTAREDILAAVSPAMNEDGFDAVLPSSIF